MTSRVIDFDEMVGGEFDFYGVDEQRFNLDGLVYEVVEDEHCVAGSCLDHVEICVTPGNFFDLPIARVVVEEVDVGIYALNDLHDGHCWLRFGTDYRCDDRGRVVSHGFVFEYTAKGVDG